MNILGSIALMLAVVGQEPAIQPQSETVVLLQVPRSIAQICRVDSARAAMSSIRRARNRGYSVREAIELSQVQAERPIVVVSATAQPLTIQGRQIGCAIAVSVNHGILPHHRGDEPDGYGLLLSQYALGVATHSIGDELAITATFTDFLVDALNELDS